MKIKIRSQSGTYRGPATIHIYTNRKLYKFVITSELGLMLRKPCIGAFCHSIKIKQTITKTRSNAWAGFFIMSDFLFPQ